MTPRAAAVKDGRRSLVPHTHLPPGHALTAASTASISGRLRRSASPFNGCYTLHLARKDLALTQILEKASWIGVRIIELYGREQLRNGGVDQTWDLALYRGERLA